MKLKEFSFFNSEDKKKLKQIFELVKQGKIKEAADLTDTLSDEARNQIPDSIWFKFSQLAEMSGTGGGAGFTPGIGVGVATKKAFGKKKKRNPYKLTNLMNEIQIKPGITPEMVKSLYSILWDNGDKKWKAVEAIRNYYDRYPYVQNEKLLPWLSRFKLTDLNRLYQELKQINSLNESLTYSKFRNEVKTRTKSQQLHRSIKEVQKRLNEINKVLEYTNRMHNELNENGDTIKYTQFTEQALSKIKEMTINLYKNIKELKK